MRRALLLLMTALMAFAGGPVPRKAAEFVIQMPNGTQSLLSSYKGKTVVLALMFTTCPHCQKMSTALSAIQKEYAAKGVQVLGATWDQGASARIAQFDQFFATGFPCGVSNNEAVMTFLQQPATDPPFVPILVFVDKTGMIRSIHMVTGDTQNGPDNAFFGNPEVNVRAELDKMLKGSGASAQVKSKAPKS